MFFQWLEQLRLQPELAACGVDVWMARQPQPRSAVDECYACLSEDETRRACRFTHDQARTCFILGRGALRAILGRYVHAAPQSVLFTYGPSGKPHLAPNLSATDVHFNLSHSGDIVLIAVAQGRDVGIDVELIRDDSDVLAIAERFFSQAESNWLANLPTQERTAAFFRLWTRKEALLKGLGHGIGWGFDRLDLSSAHDTGEIPLAVEPSAGKSWLIFDVPAVKAYQAAIAVEAT